MLKLRKMKETLSNVSEHVKRNFGAYIIVTILGYLGFHVYKMVSDTGKNSNGEPYYKEFEEPESEEIVR